MISKQEKEVFLILKGWVNYPSGSDWWVNDEGHIGKLEFAYSRAIGDLDHAYTYQLTHPQASI